MIKYLVNVFSPYKNFLSEYYLFLTDLAWTPKQILLRYGIRKSFGESVPNYSNENMDRKFNIINMF